MWNSGEWLAGASSGFSSGGVTPRKKNMPGTFCARNEKSSAPITGRDSVTRSSPTPRPRLRVPQAVSGGSLWEVLGN